MRARSSRLFATALIMSAVVAWGWGGTASAATRISYSGQSIAVKATVSSNTTVLADTGSLPSAGGTLEASSISGTVSQTVTSTTLHAAVVGQGDRVRSEASVAALTVTAGLNSISADLAMARAMAVSQGGSATVSGLSHVDGLTVNGVPVVVTGTASQTIPLLDGQLVINEQTATGGGDNRSITVNALHITTSSGTDVVLGSARSGVVAGSQNCSGTNQFTSGGGWILPPGATAKRSFGFIGGVQQNQTFRGHLVYVNQQTSDRVEGRVTLYTAVGNNRHMDGTGQVNGQTGSFSIDVVDNGEPGTQDTFSITYTCGGDSGMLGGGNIQDHQICH